MIISSLFSFVIYTSINSEFKRIEYYQKERQERLQKQMPQYIPDEPTLVMDAVHEARNRVILTLLFINAGILVISGGAGYFLAGRTLRPIQKVLDEQKRFVVDASHELRTPLTALRSELEVSLREKNLSVSGMKRLLKSNLEEVIHLQTLSDGLLTLAKNHNVEKFSFTHTTLLSVLEDSLKKVMPLAKKKKITIMHTIDDGKLYGNKQALSELFIILLDNAIKYSPEKSEIIIKSKKSKKQLSVQIIDRGIGIDREEKPYIFDRFYRADKARTHSGSSGYGLGLSIAKKILTDHGGEILVSSTRGSTFTVKLPLSEVS